MNRATLVRGIQLVVLLTLLSFAVVLWRGVSAHQTDLRVGLSTLRPAWLLVAALCALQEGVCGGTRMFVLGRVLCPQLRWRTAVASEFVLMFVWREPTPSDELRKIKEKDPNAAAATGAGAGAGGMPSVAPTPTPAAGGKKDPFDP